MRIEARACAQRRWRSCWSIWTSPKTHSRPHVSDDNPYSEAQFKTLKYRPDFPARLGSIEDARTHCREFFRWYNTEHRHSGIALMPPDTVHLWTLRRSHRTTRRHARRSLRRTSGSLQRSRTSTTHGPACRMDQSTKKGNHRTNHHTSLFLKLMNQGASNSLTCSASTALLGTKNPSDYAVRFPINLQPPTSLSTIVNTFP